MSKSIKERTRILHIKLSTVTAKGQSIVPFPGSPSWWTLLVVQVSLSTESSVLLTGRCKSSKLSVFVHRVADPVDPWIVADSSMCRIHQNHLKVLVSWILQSRWYSVPKIHAVISHIHKRANRSDIKKILSSTGLKTLWGYYHRFFVHFLYFVNN